MPSFSIRIAFSPDSYVDDIRSFCDSYWIRITNKKTKEMLLYATPWWLPAVGNIQQDNWNNRTGVIAVTAESVEDLQTEAVLQQKSESSKPSYRNPFFVKSPMRFMVFVMDQESHQITELLNLYFRV